MRTALAFLFLAALGCGKPEATSEPPKPNPVAGNPDPKPKDQANPGPKEQPKPAEITWATSELNGAPGYLMPCDGAEKSDPEKVLERVRKDLATDKATNDLLKKLIRVETLTFEVVTAPAPEKAVFAHPPRGEDDGLLMVYFQPGKRSEVKGRTFLDFQYSVVSSRSSTLFGNADNFDPVWFAINDFLLRNKLGYVLNNGSASRWDEAQKVSAEESRKKLDAEIAEYLKKNARLPLKRKP
jgi:hypothetical protein